MERATIQTAVALLSGGLDSGVALAMWLDAGASVELAVTVDYGQRSAARELAVGEALAARYGVPWQRLELPWLGEVAAGSALVAGGPELPRRTVDAPGDERSAAAVWIPARNVVLIAAAAAIAEARGAGSVLVGFNREEAATFPDNSTDFVDRFRAVLALGTRCGVGVDSPTLTLTKVEIVAEARRLGLGPEDFWSCYGGGRSPCGECESCVRSARAWG